MRVALKTAWALIKRKKVQSLLIGTIIMLMATLLYIGMSMFNQSSTFTIMFERANATESLLFINNEVFSNDETTNIEDTRKWWENQDEVESTVTYDMLLINGESIVEGELESETVYITEYIEDSEFDIIYETDVKIAETPTGNEMLINYNFAKNRGLSVGDSVSFKYNGFDYDFIVSGYVVDPQFSTPFISPNRCFVRPDFFEENEIITNQTIIGVKYKDIDNTNDYDLYEAYKETSGGQFLFIDYESLKASYNTIISIIATILLAISVLIFAIIIYVIRSVVTNQIFQQYKQIGVKKAIGYTDRQIRTSFLWMYGGISIIASILGVFIGIPIRNIVNSGISYDIQVGQKTSVDGYTLITVVVIVFLVMLFTARATKQVNKVKPVQAIKYGMPESSVATPKFNITKYKKLPLSLLLAIKQILINRKKTITTTITMTMLIYVAFIINNIGYSIGNEAYFLRHLTGLEVGDFAIVNSSSNTVADSIDTLEAMDEVERAVFYRYVIGESTEGVEEDEKVSIGCFIIYGDYPEDSMNIAEGRQPQNNLEVVISSSIAEKTGKTIGDYILISTAEGEVDFFVSGIYNTVNMNGDAYVSIREEIPETILQSSGTYWVYSSQEHVIIEEMEGAINSLTTDQLTITRYDSVSEDILSTVEQFPTMINSLLIIFIIICGAIILNTSFMDINNSTRLYGIMKATGNSSQSITKVMVIKSLIMTTLGIVIGFILHILTANVVMCAIFSVTPFSSIEIPILIDGKSSIIIMCLFILIAIIATLIPSQRISTISPKQLITE